MQITMGKVDGKNLAVDTDTLRRSHLLLTGTTGSGKSYRMRVLAESLFPVMPVFLFDPEGEYYTLREKFPFMLFSAEGGDAPMAVETAALTARKVLEWKKSAIFDLYGLEVEQQHEWMRLFLSALMTAPRELWGPVACLIDEAHLWAPEKGEGVSVASGAMKNLCARGRKRGIFVTLATQRITKLANNCVSEMQNYLMGRTTLTGDVERAAKVLGATVKADKDAFSREIKTLKDHVFFAQGIALSPDRLKLGPMPAQTTHIRPGDIQTVIPAAPAEIQAFLPQLSSLAKEAKQEATTHEQLQRRVHELTADLATARSGKPAVPSPEVVAELEELRQFKQRALSALKAFSDASRRLVDELAPLYQSDINSISPVVLAPAEDRGGVHLSEVRFWPNTQALEQALAAPSNGTHAPAEPLEEQEHPKARAQQKLLEALAAAERVRIPSLSRTWLALAARVSPTSSSYRANVSALEKAGLVTYPTLGDIALTDTGRARVTGLSWKFTTVNLLDALQKVFQASRYKVIEALVREAGDGWMSREALAAAAGQSPTSSAYRAHLAELRDLGLVQVGANSTVRVHPFIFLHTAVPA